MLNSGDIVAVDLGAPAGREAGFHHPAVVITAQAILDSAPSVVHIVPLTSTLRGFATEVVVEANHGTGLDHVSAAQCQHVRAVSPARLGEAVGNVGPAVLAQLREMLAVILDLPQ